MGCGASKSSSVSPGAIVVKPQTRAPSDSNNGDVSDCPRDVTDCPRVPPVTTSAEPQQMPIAQDQPEIESTENKDGYSEGTPNRLQPSTGEGTTLGRPSAETINLPYDRSHDHVMPGEVEGRGGSEEMAEHLGSTSQGQQQLMTPVAFEVDMAPDGSAHRKALPPRRLVSLESAPKLTTDMLLEKQRLVEQRRAQELERRKTSGLPPRKKDKLLKDIMTARQLEANDEQMEEIEQKLSSSDLNQPNRVSEATHKQAQKTRRNGDEDSVEMEVDDNYNAESCGEL